MNINVIKKIIKQRHLLVFLAIAALLWYFNKLNHRYTSQIPISIEITSDFDSDMWIDNTKLEVSANCEGYGRQLIVYKLGFTPLISIPSSQLKFQGIENLPYHYTIDQQSLAKALQQKVNNINVNFVAENITTILMSPLATRKIPIENSIQIDCAKQYMQSSKTQITPDSVIVRAPSAILDTLKSIKTQLIEFKNITSSLKGTVKLMTPNHSLLEFDKVKYKALVTAFTEMNFQLTINVKNQPKNIVTTIIPSKTNVTVKIPLDMYHKGLKPVASIDYNYLSNSTLYPVTIDSLPSEVKLITTDPLFVEPFFESVKE